MKKNRAQGKKPLSQAEIERRRKINAAIRHAEQIISQTGVYEPVVYRPKSSVPTCQTHRAAEPASRGKTGEPAVGADPREALDLSPSSAISATTQGSAAPALPASRGNAPSQSEANGNNEPRPVVQKTKKVRTLGAEDLYPSTISRKSKSSKAKEPAKKGRQTPQKSKANAKAAKIAAAVSARRKAREQAAVAEGERKKVANSSLRKAKEANAASRIAFNARIREQREAEASVAVAPSPFVKLQREWNAAFSILLRYEDEDPNARNVVDARRHLSLIEAEWERRHGLSFGDPDYFPWPSTEIASASLADKPGSIVRHERGMLGYLGYHVGISSPLTTAQRARLLGQIFMMRLPPLNDLDYMASWGRPRSGPRLRKIAESIASFVKTAKRRTTVSLDMAIGHWEADLIHMRRCYYDGNFDFHWPKV